MPSRGSQSRTTLLIASVAVGGVVALAGALLAYPPALDGAILRKAIVLTVLTAVAELVAIQVRHGKSGELLTLFELAVVSDLVLLPASLAPITAVAGLALALAVQRRPPVKFVFNLGQYALGVVAAAALYHGLGHGDFGTTGGLVWLFAGMASFTVINLVTISAIISATDQRPLRKVLAEERGISIAMGLGNSAVGMVAVSLYLSRPALLPAVLAPTLALHLAFRGWVQEKELSRRMEEESTKLGRILEHSSEGIVLADADGVVLLWSPSMERTTGVPADEAVGKALSYLVRGRDVFGRPVAVDVSSDPEPSELEIIATDGTARWLRVQHGPGLDARGALSFDVLVITDVTRQREVDKLKDDFFSTVSHELRTPLTPIKGYANLLLRRIDDIPADRRREALQSIVERADHMGRLVEDLLLASRVANEAERRLPEVARKPVNLEQVCEKALRSFRTAHPLRELTLAIDPDLLAAGEPVAVGDPLRVEQIVAHLISNAVKFSDEGSPVEVTVAREDTEMLVHVRDEGRGIPAGRSEEIFEKFKRLEDPLRMETGGAGLGLFIVKQLTAAMSGSVSVQSEPGRGSTFTVALPMAGQTAPVIVPQRRAEDLAG